MILFSAALVAAAASAAPGQQQRHRGPSPPPTAGLSRLLWGEVVVAIHSLGTRFRRGAAAR